jgi:hypothetical protein
MSALLATIFSTTMNIANADSFPFSPITPSTVQSQPRQQQDIKGTMITTNSDKLRLTDQPFPLSSLLPPLQQSQSQPSQ